MKVLVIGGGISGLSILRELSKYDIDLTLVEKTFDIPSGASKANSAIIHSGYDDDPQTLKAKLAVLGNSLFDELSSELDFSFTRNGSLTVAFTGGEVKKIEELKIRGEKNGVSGLQILSKEETLKLEPNLNKELKVSLFAPSAGIVSPFAMSYALFENAIQNKAKVIFNTEVKSVVLENKKVKGVLTTDKKFIRGDLIINAAGVNSDLISYSASIDDFSIEPARGEYFVFDDQLGKLISRTIFKAPQQGTKGVLVCYDVFKKIIIGPNHEVLKDKEDTKTTKEGLFDVFNKAKELVPSLNIKNTITYFSGIRALPSTGDFIIKSYPGSASGFINVAGIKSPGFTASYAIAHYVKDLIKDLNFKLEEKRDFNPLRKSIPRFRDLSFTQKEALIKKDKRWGHIICRCEEVSEMEIIEAIKRGAKTLDGVKFRTQAGFGRCQGGFCKPRIIEILSRELNIPFESITKCGGKSSFLVEKNKEKFKDEQEK